jgi:hypothetical protein
VVFGVGSELVLVVLVVRVIPVVPGIHDQDTSCATPTTFCARATVGRLRSQR